MCLNSALHVIFMEFHSKSLFRKAKMTHKKKGEENLDFMLWKAGCSLRKGRRLLLKFFLKKKYIAILITEKIWHFLIKKLKSVNRRSRSRIRTLLKSFARESVKIWNSGIIDVYKILNYFLSEDQELVIPCETHHLTRLVHFKIYTKSYKKIFCESLSILNKEQNDYERGKEVKVAILAVSANSNYS